MQTRPIRSLALAVTLATAGGCATVTETDVDIETPDGVMLRATYTSPGKPGPGILLLHMCNSDRSAWKGLAVQLADRGFHVLAPDYRGFGDSGGEMPEDSLESRTIREETWPSDIDVVLDDLVRREGVDGEKLGAAGGSCGVNQAIQLARRHPEVKTLALLAGSTDTDGQTFLAETPWMPILGSASRDDFGAVESLRWTVGFSANPKNRFLEYSVGGHGTEMFASHDDLEPTIADWFEEHLIRQPVSVSDAVPQQAGPSLAVMTALRAADGPARAREQLQAARERGEASPLPPEGAINVLGYELLQNGEIERAIAVFELNVEAYPQSANTYDSLGDGYLAAGDSERAAEYAEKTLQALPDDPNTEEDYRRSLREAAEGKLGAAAGG